MIYHLLTLHAFILFASYSNIFHHLSGVRDYIHIMDLAEGHAAAIKVLLKEKGNTGIFKAYNLGTGSGSSVLEVKLVIDLFVLLVAY